MLEPSVYNLEESYHRLRPCHHSWVTQNNPEVFSSIGLPLRVSSLRELIPFVESMQDGRFPGYQKMLGGAISDSDFAEICGVMSKVVEIQANISPSIQVLPIEALVAAYCWVGLIKEAMPRLCSVVEIGPGPGYGSAFLSGAVSSYTSVEVTQPYYLLQNLILHQFYSAVNELADPHARVELRSVADRRFNGARIPDLQLVSLPIAKRGGYGNIITSHGASATHVPYWRVADLADFIPPSSVDLLVANACLNEISLNALDFYLTEAKKFLRSRGLLFFMCPGLRHDRRALPEILESHGFVRIFSGLQEKNSAGVNGVFFPVLTEFWMLSGGAGEPLLDHESLKSSADGKWLSKFASRSVPIGSTEYSFESFAESVRSFVSSKIS